MNKEQILQDIRQHFKYSEDKDETPRGIYHLHRFTPIDDMTFNAVCSDDFSMAIMMAKFQIDKNVKP